MARSFIDASEWLPGFGPQQVPPSVSLEPVKEVRKESLVDVVLEVVAPQSVEDIVLVQAANKDAETDTVLVPRWRPVIEIEQPQRPAPWPVLDPRLLEESFAGARKFSANLAAIKVLKAIESERRTPSDEDRRVLNCFTGWGSLPGAFNQDQQDPAWVERSQQLERLLDEQEYESSRQSVLSSHYTPPAVIQCMWEAVQRLGFRAGRILEPAAGVGYFVGLMPREMIDNSQVTAVEVDQLAGRILKALYRDHGVDVRISPLEHCVLPSEWYDLVIGNVPFGDFRLSDPAHRPYSSFSCHNYFIGKSLDLVRPGGLVCLITSSFTLEAWDRSVRAYLSSEAELIAAIRLPCRTFQAIAGTDVQTDILILRKRAYGETPSAAWVEREKAPATLCQSSYAKDVFCNRYFLDHPEMLIGKLCKRRTAYGEADVAMLETPLQPELVRCVAALPEGVYRSKERCDTRSALQVAPEVEPGWRQGSYRIHNARIVRLAGGELVDVHDQFAGTMRSRIAGLIEIRDAVRELLRLQLELGDSLDVGETRAKLGRVYDRFVAKHGFLSSSANVRAFRGDPDLPLLLSLEVWDEESETAEKAVIFARNTTRRVTPPVRSASPEEALIASLAWRGEVHMEYMAGLLGTDEQTVSTYLIDAGQVFLDPASGKFETADEYLSGNIRKKLAQALVAGVKFARNVAALESVMPPTIDATKIVARLGAVWIPADDVEGFAHHLFGDEEVKVAYSSTAGTWAVKYNDWATKRNVRATQEFGTSRMHGMELIADALNGQAPTVRDKEPHSERMIVNRAETLAAREKLDAINRAFGIWLFGEPERRARLEKLYNSIFNSTRPRRFDGSYLTLPGFSGAIDPYPHTLSGVARILQRGNTLIGHAVGSGKTALASIASMELRRLGLARKPMHVVPNNVLLQYAAEVQRLYPGASILVAGKEDLEKSRRKEFAARVATGDWDAVVIAHSSFELIPMSQEHVSRAIRETIAEIEMVIRSLAGPEARGNRIVRQLETMKRRWKTRLEELSAEGKKDDLVTFEELGVDYLFVDEAHAFKSLQSFSKLPRVPGMPSANSQRAFDMFLKTRYVMSMHGARERGVVFMTATFVCNTVAELHVFQRYLQPSRLEELGLETFDAWVTTFGEVVSCLELSPEGKGYRLASRLARFNNVPELMAIFTEVADVQTDEMLSLPKPAIRGGKPQAIVVPNSADLSEFVDGLVKRAEQIRGGLVEPSKDNMLAVTNDGRKAALDLRLVGALPTEEHHCKINACVKEVYSIWKETAEERSTQLIFCDLSVPKSQGEFSVYHEIRRKLVSLGVPEQEVRYIHEANTDQQRIKLFREVRSGKVRVLIGSTDRMGVGTNVQERAIALHTLTAPWRPDQMHQADGRVVRPGNRNSEVRLFRYVREGSFDSYIYQLLETKSRFIAQVLSGNKGIRSIEDVQMAALTYAEIKALASGSPLVIEKAAVDAEIAKLSTLFSVWRQQRWRNESEIAVVPAHLERLRHEIRMREQDVEKLQEVSMATFSVSLGGVEIRGAEAAGARLRAIALNAVLQSKTSPKRIEDVVGSFGGLQLGVREGRFRREDNPEMFLKGHFEYPAGSYLQGPSIVAGLLDSLKSVACALDRARQRLTEAEQRASDLERELDRPFENEERLTNLMCRQRELDDLLDLDKSSDGGLEQAA